MTNNVQLIVGLGNPGPEYINTRHNAGEWFVKAIADKYNISLRPEKKYLGHYGKGFIGNEPVHLLIPTTFMNKSGHSVAPLANFYRINVENILVAHDELDLPTGTAKIKQGGGHGGHNGLRDIIACMGNNKDFYRLRLGIDHPGHKDRVTGYVLGKPPVNERYQIDQCIDTAVNSIEVWQKDGLKKAQHTLHSFKAT